MPEGLKSFWALTVACLKMLFRKSTRKRFICLVLSFLFLMGLNTFFFLQRYHEVEIAKRAIMDEKAFKVFFLRARTREDGYRFAHESRQNVARAGGRIVPSAFVYQNNLFVHIDPPSQSASRDKALVLIDSLFGISRFARSFFAPHPPAPYLTKIRDAYMDHNGADLPPQIVSQRHEQIQRDLYDMADMIRLSLSGRRMLIYNESVRKVVENLHRNLGGAQGVPNPYLSRVEAVIPVNLLYLFSRLQEDTTTDIEDLAQAIEAGDDGIETFADFLTPPEPSAHAVDLLYVDIDAYPRYIPVYVPALFTQGWHWLMYHDLRLNQAFMDFLGARHFKGNLLFSYEKTQILQNRTQRINNDLRSNQRNFYLTDLAMGIAFPFMISLFSFIHLKTELAFLLMFKNRIRQLLTIFWSLPLLLMLMVKGALAIGFIWYAGSRGTAMDSAIALPLLLSFVVAAAVFYPINRWCFSSFTGDTLCLYELHKGR